MEGQGTQALARAVRKETRERERGARGGWGRREETQKEGERERDGDRDRKRQRDTSRETEREGERDPDTEQGR